MVSKQLDAATLSVDTPTWKDGAFTDPDAQQLWAQLPASLQIVARSELAAGNTVRNILRNSARSIVLLAFERPPMTGAPSTIDIHVHTTHESGHYCYDGAVCTYEERRSGSFLAFDDPDYEDAL
ncbi:hypothetical protein [Sinimarinibacterium flocculans]|uniref:hypothetical protein n=1 Tax=Sinimarinibacterium flocculans TaxID=985250 RepID=UPI003514C265